MFIRIYAYCLYSDNTHGSFFEGVLGHAKLLAWYAEIQWYHIRQGKLGYQRQNHALIVTRQRKGVSTKILALKWHETTYRKHLEDEGGEKKQ